MCDRILDEATILTFRDLLEKHGMGKQDFETVRPFPTHGT